jgi:hypothetical protein
VRREERSKRKKRREWSGRGRGEERGRALAELESSPLGEEVRKSRKGPGSVTACPERPSLAYREIRCALSETNGNWPATCRKILLRDSLAGQGKG